MIYLLPLVAAIAPFFLWAVELYLPYPFIIEEAAKTLMVFPLLTIDRPSEKFKMGMVIGFLFAISESTLYIFNIQAVGSTATLIERLILTTPLHIATTLIILVFGVKNKKLIVLGFVVAAVIHLLYNYFVRLI
jgi:RsiW-degrading membrane proteinase PrsW (M82 family)